MRASEVVSTRMVGELTCVHRAEILKRIHGGLFRRVEVLGLGASAEDVGTAFVAAESHFCVLD